jgi:hypothetical protein
MTPNTTPVTPGTYDVGGITITVAANRFDVATVAEFQTVASGAAALSFGQEIVLCPGSYNPSRTGWTVTRTNLPSGTWIGSNYIVVRGMTLGAVIGNVTCAGTGQDNFYFSFENLTFDCAGRAGAQLAAVKSNSGARFIRVKDCAFVGSVNPARFTGTDLYDAIDFNDQTAGDFVIEGNSFYDVDRPMSFSGPDCIIRNNVARRFWGDGIQIIKPCQRLKVIGNDLSDIKAGYTPRAITAVTRGTTTQVTVDDATGMAINYVITLVGMTGLDGAETNTYTITAVAGNVITIDLNSTAMPDWVSGGSAWYSNAHGDFLQGLFSSATDGQLDDIEISANRFTMGAEATPYLASGQGIFLTGHPSGVFLRRIRIQGNICEINVTQGIQAVRALDAEICYNTIIKRLGWGKVPGTATIGSTDMSTGCRVYGNVANNFIITGAAVAVNNHTLAYDATDYAAAFDNPVTGIAPVVGNVNYAPKAGGPLAIASPIIGAVPHQSYVSPWTMTKPTPNSDAPAVPDAFTVGMWTLLNPGTGGSMTVVIGSLPFSNFATITNIEYEVNSSGTWVSSGGIATFNVAGLTNGSLTSFRIRAVNSAGTSAASDTKSETPTLDTSIRLVGYKVEAFGGSTDVTRPLTGFSGSVTAPQEGDCVVLACFHGTNANRAISITSAGWTGINGIYANDTYDINAFVGVKVMGATPDPSVTFNFGGDSTGRPVLYRIYRNVDPTTPLDVAIPTPTALSNTTISDPPAITPITTGAMLVIFGGAAHNDAAAPAFSAPYLSNVHTWQNNTVSALAGELLWPGGTYDPAALTISRNSTTDSAAGITLALRPKP